MKYQLVPKTGWNVSKLSFGCMRFRDEETAAEAVRKAIELGVNYFDVAPGYGGGAAGPFLGKGIRGLRDKAIITAKSSPGNGGDGLSDYNPKAGFGIRTADEARREIDQSMEFLGVDHLDMYQFWALHSDVIFDEGVKPGGFMEGVMKARDEGLFDYIGMTTHSESDHIIRYLKNSPYEFDMVTLPFHPRNAGRGKAIDYCAERGIGVVAMNPLAGGMLGRPAAVFQKVADDLGLDSMVEASLRFVAGFDNITTALNGITLAEHAIQGAAAIEKGPLTGDVAGKFVERLDEVLQNVPAGRMCTGCGYCGECPEGIAIPELLGLYTDLLIPSMADAARAKIAEHAAGHDPSTCTACKQCEEKCPNGIPVSEMMAEAAKTWNK